MADATCRAITCSHHPRHGDEYPSSAEVKCYENYGVIDHQGMVERVCCMAKDVCEGCETCETDARLTRAEIRAIPEKHWPDRLIKWRP